MVGASLVHLLGLGLLLAATARRLESVPGIGDPVEVRHIPCNNPGCKKGAEGKVYAFSALHDVSLREVTLFVDIGMGKEEAPQRLDVECLFWSGDYRLEGAEPVKAPAQAVRIFDNQHRYVPYAVKCSDPVPLLQGMPLWASFVMNGQDTGIRLLVEQVGLERKGVVGACNAVVSSNRFELLYEWLVHYTKLGVDGFHIYFTNSTVNWDENPGRERRAQESDADVPQPFNYPKVTWWHFEHLTLEDRFLYSQTTIYNDCVYRNRHAYQYLVMFDMDEFLVIRDSRFTRKRGLETLLAHIFPPQHAAVGIYRYAYRDDCGEPASKQIAFLERFTHRLKEPESSTVLNSKRLADKLVIRPDRVDIFYMHFLASVRDSYTLEARNAQPAIVHLMHLRSYGQDCSELTEEPPYDQD